MDALNVDSNVARSTVDDPVFLVGAERSGTTLLRLMLDHHPQISFSHQLEFVVDWVGDDGRLPDLLRYWTKLEESDVFRRSGLAIDKSLDYMGLVNAFLNEKRGTRAIVGGSVHRNPERLLHLWPHARMIHIVRDPRAVARSVVDMGWAGNPWSAVASWIIIEQSWNRLRERLPASDRHELRYEDLVIEPRRELERICAFLRIPYHDGVLSYPADSSYGLPDPTALDAWRTKLSRREQRQVEARTGGLLRERGYPVENRAAISIRGIQRFWLRLHDRLGRSAFRCRRYGWKLYLQQVFARRTGNDSWRRRIAARTRAIDARHLK